MEQRLIYSESRGTWNLFVNNEWYFEGTWEQCTEMMLNNYCAYDYECTNAGYDEY